VDKIQEKKPTYEELSNKVQEYEIQEKVFQTVIEQLESVYANLASFQTEVEEKNRQLEEEREKLRVMNEQLRIATESAEEANRAKTDFLNTVSHELRTPLTSVLGFAKIIRKKLEEVVIPAVKADDGKTMKALKQINGNIGIIVSEGERLTHLINDVLDLAKMEAGKISWNMQSVSISEIVKHAISATSALFEQKGLKILMDVDEILPDIAGDRDRLIQVVINLISNAVKFTEKGFVICSAKLINGEIRVSITDSGIGISEEDQPKVFEKFKQVGDALTDRPTGSGLGLPICKEIIEHHRGRLWVESKLGAGSTFSFALPLSSQDLRVENIDLDTLIHRLKEHMASISTSTEQGKTILIVDDDAAIREFIRQGLESEGYRVSEAANGIEGVKKAKKEQPALIVLDVMMPEMDGFDAAAILKNDPVTMSIPIVILSVVEDKERGYRVGVDRYLTKPFEMEMLIREIGGLISKGFSNKKIMIVDEDESTVKALSELLETRGYSVASACNGMECINKALTFRPDMIILNRIISDSENMVKTLRFEKGLENIYFVYIEESNK
jgi:signal transduction histidine kinase/DNA-binding response OmpR family regulator